MTRAELCIPRILKHEGGFVDHPNDPGGATNLGVTLASFRRYVKPGGSVADLKRLTVEQATVVYKRQYWDKVMADSLPVGVDYAVADFAVNSGPSRAAKYLQGVVGAVQDGKVGPNTIAAVRAYDAGEVVRQLCANRMSFLKRLSHWSTFGKGWTRRVTEVERDALADIREQAPVAPPARETPSQPNPFAALFAAIASLFKGRKA